MPGPNYIHVRDSDDIVVGVFSDSESTLAGVTEYFESHPLWIPSWTSMRWKRASVDTYSLTGDAVDFHHGVDPDGDRFGISSDDVLAGFHEEKVTGDTGKITLTTVTDSAGYETREIGIGADVFDKTTDGIDKVLDVDTTTSPPTMGQILQWNGSLWIPSSTGGAIFGSEFQQVSDEALSSTTSEEDQTKVSFSVTPGTAGKYRVGWYLEFQNDNGNGSVLGRVKEDGITVAQINDNPSNNTGFSVWGGFYYSDLIEEETVYLLTFARGGVQGTAFCRRARFEFWRVN